MASKIKKKTKVNPLVYDVELEELGLPPSTSDLAGLFESELDVSARSGGENGTEGSFLEKLSSSDSPEPHQLEELSTRSSTPSSAKAFAQKLKRNVVTPITEKGSHGPTLSSSRMEAWSDSGGESSVANPSDQLNLSKASLERPESAPSSSSKRSFASNKVTPISAQEISHRHADPQNFRALSPVARSDGELQITDSATIDGVVRKLSWDASYNTERTSNDEVRASNAYGKMLAQGDSPSSPKTIAVKPAWEMSPDTGDKVHGNIPQSFQSDEDFSLAERNANIDESLSRASPREEQISGRESSQDESGNADSQVACKELALQNVETNSLASREAVLALPRTVGEQHAYIPMEYAKQCIQKVIEDMKKMKQNHFHAIEEIQKHYQLIEDESQGQFNAYVIKLRGEYGTKVALFKRVIEAHQADFQAKQKFYENAIQSLRDKNRAMLIEKRLFLLNSKETRNQFEDDKRKLTKDLTSMLDEKHKELLSLAAKVRLSESGNDRKAQQIFELEAKVAELDRKFAHASGEASSAVDKLNILKASYDELNTRFLSKLSENEDQALQIGNLKTSSGSEVAARELMEAAIQEKELLIAELRQKIVQLETRPEREAPHGVSLVSGNEANASKDFPQPSEVLPSSVELSLASDLLSGNLSSADQQPTSSEIQTAVQIESGALSIPLDSVPRKPSSEVRQSDPSNEETRTLKQEIANLQLKLRELETKSMYDKQAAAKEKHDLCIELSNANEAKRKLNLDVIEAVERNKVLHQRLETTLNAVVDSVDPVQTKIKLDAALLEKASLETEIKVLQKTITEWTENFEKANPGKMPTDDDKTEEIVGGLEELKQREENVRMIEKDIVVMNMLLDGSLPDDMKHDDDLRTDLGSVTSKLANQFNEEREDFKRQIEGLTASNQVFADQVARLKSDLEKLESEKPSLSAITLDQNQVESVSTRSKSEQDATMAQERALELEAEHAAEVESLKQRVKKLESKVRHVNADKEKAEAAAAEAESQYKVAQASYEAELASKQKELEVLRREVDTLNRARLSKLPVNVKAEVQALQDKLRTLEDSREANSKELIGLRSENPELKARLEKLNSEIERLKATETKHEAELQKQNNHYEKKIKELKRTSGKNPAAPASLDSSDTKVQALERKIADLQKQLEDAGTDSMRPTTSAGGREKKDSVKAPAKVEKENEKLKEQIATLKQAAQVDADKIKELLGQVKEAKAAGNDKNAKKQDKALKELTKKLESEQKKAEKFKEDLDKTREELAALRKDFDVAQTESRRDKDEIAKLSLAAKEGVEAAERAANLEVEVKALKEENATLAENFNSERVLRKKYYNMVEDMKGKIRVYARARPLSKSERDRGNFSIVNSPDEYTLIVQTPRGPKDFQYDQVFLSEASQDKVFEDTNNLIQSAVDGYNVCIFAYGQTGSGKTFTMIGDKEQNYPGIAPRSFKAIYKLIDENKKKFTFTTQMYMLELYMDRLIDLFAPKGANSDKLDIKKDKKGMVVVSGAVVQDAHSAEELMELFERGSSTRHIASTKMNAESSRSHLILSIIIESTSLTNGAVVRGKLSLVDLAGSERAAKTGATPEQLKEAQSINKSLSALGDVISALSSDQSFIPYRNNKLTMLMQDSLGGNAKTLMFVNISPADYNADETVTSLTYASRVKLITNDASKNADNKEIARLKQIIAKLKKGEAVEDEDVE